MEESREQTASDTPGKMSLFSHLVELRSRLIKAVISVAIGFIAAWNAAEIVLQFLLNPIAALLPEGQHLIFTGLQDGFVITLKVSLWTGLFISAPFWMYQFWAFVAPALYPAEKKHVGRLAALATTLVIAGAAFAYFLVFPIAFRFFLNFSGEMLTALPAVDRYCSLAMSLLLAFALAFQLPLLLMFLGKLGIITDDFLRRQRRYAILIMFIGGAVLTPPDVISQIMLAAALMILYELSIFLVARQKTETDEKPDTE